MSRVLLEANGVMVTAYCGSQRRRMLSVGAPDGGAVELDEEEAARLAMTLVNWLNDDERNVRRWTLALDEVQS